MDSFLTPEYVVEVDDETALCLDVGFAGNSPVVTGDVGSMTLTRKYSEGC